MTKRYAAVFTDSRPLPNLDWCLRAHRRFLPRSWECLVFTCAKNAPCVAAAGASLVELPEQTTDTYAKMNQYRGSPEFWSQLLPYSRVLIFEPDSRILRRGISEFLEWDYVGAPWPHEPYKHKVGNGGLSLRNPAIMLKIAQQFSFKDTVQEDIFFVYCMKEVGGKVAPLKVAQRFSCEMKFKLGTWGCHQIHKHLNAEQIRQVLTQYNNKRVPSI